MSGPRWLPEAIQWHEGMLLAPQHFQQSALRQEGLLHYHASFLAPFHWGFSRLSFDLDLLLQGVLRVTELEAVMPDGLIVSRSPGDPGDLEADLTPLADQIKRGPLAVHLAVPGRRAGLSPVKGDLPRYESLEGDPVADESTGDGDVRIPRLRPRATLLVTDAPPQKYVSMPIARVVYEEENYALSSYLPPLLRVAPGSPVAELGSGIAQRLREKAVFLSERVRSPMVASRPPQLLETKAMIQSLVAGLPHFEAVLGTGRSHPYALYLALTWIVGNAAALGRGLVPPLLEPYDHDDPWASFERARQFLFRVIDEGILESYTAFPFHLEHGLFNLAFDEAWRDRRLVMGVRGLPGMTETEVVAWVEECLIGSQERMPSMRNRRILGAARRRIEGDGDLVPASGVVMFALEADPEFIETNDILQVWNAGDRDRPGASEVILYVRNRTQPG